MKIRVLGAAAGGGFPQWNCNCPNCSGVRSGQLRAHARTQSSIAVSDNGERWVLFNASPDILTQLRAAPAFQPARQIRDTAISAIVLTDSQIDHTTGLLMLREGNPLEIYCTESVRADLTTTFPLFRVLDHYCGVRAHVITLGGEKFEIDDVPGLRFTAVALAGKAPPYSSRRNAPQHGDNIGVAVESIHRGKTLFYAPGLEAIAPPIKNYFSHSDCILVDGTCWVDDELIRLGISKKRAGDMGHLPQSGAGGMLEQLNDLKRPRKVLIHINNTNPILNEDSTERAQLTAAGIEVAYDGMEINL